MRAVVLVGGFGTRLRPLTLDRPKQMLPILGRPMIEPVLEHLSRHGIDDVVLSMGYRPDAFTAEYPSGVCAGVALHFAVEPEPLDTAGAIRFAARDAGIDERFVVMNADVLTDIDVGALIAFHDERGAEGTIALHKVEDPSAFGVVPTDAQGRVEAFVEKPPRDEAPTDLINAGIYVLEPSVLDRIAADRRVSIEREVFPAMVADGTLYAQADDAYWIDAGTPALYIRAQLDLIDGLRGGTHEGVDPAATIDAAAEVQRSVVGAGCTIAAGAVVRDSVLLPGATVGEGAVIERTVLAFGAAVDQGAALTDCVIGDGETVPSGTRLDEVRQPAPA
jgi:mannose-1-phosphate guanylyltransferase